MTTVLKLGGSDITDKERPETVDSEALAGVAEQVARFVDSGDDQLVLVHGGGSFGHHHAATHGVSSTEGSADASALREIHGAMTALNDAVLEELGERDIDGLPVRPLSVAHRDSDGRLTFPSGQIERMLGEGFLPVCHGDVIAHEGRGGTVVSGDDLVVSLARSLSADRVGLCSTVPGVLDGSGAVVPEITDFGEVADALGGSDATDVTGGMAGKVETLLELDAPAAIFGASQVGEFLRGGSPGTLVSGR